MRFWYLSYLIKSSILLFVCSITIQLSAQGIVKGKVLDSLSSDPLSFASVRIFQSSDKKLINGNITSEAGDFTLELPAGNYYGEIEFMGYKTFQIAAFLLEKNTTHNLGSIKLTSSTSVLNEVVVQAQKSSMELSLDKKIFNVGQDLANAGGNASDILTNIPSVSVDPEGNIKLRGSDNVRILIDGKPSGLVSFKGGSGLQQLQANMIERVEVITNPSARYEAEGMAGIINIVLKKNNAQGFNATFDAIMGYPNNFGGAANVNYRHKKMNFFVNYGISYRKQPGISSIYQEVYDDDTTFILKQNNRGSILGFNNNIRGGLDYYFNEKSILTASYLFRRSDATRITNIRYEDYYFTTSNQPTISTRRQDETEQEPNSEYSLVYKKSFVQKGHDLIGEIKFLDNWESSNQVFRQRVYRSDNTEDFSKAKLQRSLNDEFEKQLLLQIDYTQPLGKERKLETGVRTSIRNMINDYIVSEENGAGDLVPLPGLDNVFEYRENISAVYGIFGNKVKKISYQAGLRVESTDVKTTVRETNEVNPRDYINLFPSAHFTLDLVKQNALQISYSRRVRRPFYNDLSPFMTFADSRNFFSGNPNLNPEFSNVMEVGHMKYFEKGSITSSLYYRHTNGKIERIRTMDDEGNSRTLPQNLLSEKSYGVEFTSEYALTRWWKLDFNFNFFHSAIDGSNIQENYKTTTYSWFARQTSRFTLPYNFDVQLRGNYEAEQKTAQGRRKALYYADVSMSKDVLKGRGTINFNVLDIFNTRKVRSIMNGTNFHTESQFQARRRQINLTISYRIKQTKQVKKAVTVEE